MTVSGANSLWFNSASLIVGEAGQGTLSITAGGRVQNTLFGAVGGSAGPGTVTVSGASSQWVNSAGLFVGSLGQGTLDITAGGVVQNTGGTVGLNFGSTGTVTVSGANSQWVNSGDLVVGNSGEGVLNISVGDFGQGTLNITAGGKVTSAIGVIAAQPSGSGLATVTGAGSTWTNTNDLFVGGNSTIGRGDGTLRVERGGMVLVADVLTIYDTGTLAVGPLGGHRQRPDHRRLRHARRHARGIAAR